MTSAMMAFGIAVGGTSLICYVLMTRSQNRNRRASGDGRSPDGSNYAASDGWTIASWFGSDHNSASDSSGNPSDLGGGDSGGGGDGGGGATKTLRQAQGIELFDPAEQRSFRVIPVCISAQFGIT
ncbi:MAG TPA: hypothetical protein VGZ92_07855 [Bradyrhizobium sp.]|jgi:hypothetical protein|nr:hypothetical protein [Bradyrhizobium sp.]